MTPFIDAFLTARIIILRLKADVNCWF